MTFGAWHIIRKDVTGSTSDDARELAREGCASDTVIVACCQKQGHGQWGRSWVSPYGGLYFSCVLRPSLPQAQWADLSPLCAAAVQRGILAACSLDERILRVKEPNDIVTDDGKVCGILLEAFDASTIVVGCGVNIMRPHEDVITDGRNIPAYISDYTEDVDGSPECLNTFLYSILRELEPILS